MLCGGLEWFLCIGVNIEASLKRLKDFKSGKVNLVSLRCGPLVESFSWYSDVLDSVFIQARWILVGL